MGKVLLLQPKIVIKPWAPELSKSKLNFKLGKNVESNTGETWEFCTESKVINTKFKGKNLGELFKQYGKEYFGTYDINILIKFIDTSDFLSLQVHPNDSQALELENEPNGKSEAWYFIDCDEGSKVVNGLSSPLNKFSNDRNINIILDNIKQNLSYANVNSDDIMIIPPGRVHAIGPGILLYEVQQYSDITYRLCDWQRNDRELHLEKGLKVITNGLSQIESIKQFYKGSIINNEHFNTSIYCIKSNDVNNMLLKVGHIYEVLTVIRGCLKIKTSENKKIFVKIGQTVCLTINSIYNIEGDGRFLISKCLKN